MRKIFPALVLLLVLVAWITLDRRLGPDAPDSDADARISPEAATQSRDDAETKRAEAVPGPGERFSEATAYRVVLAGGRCELRAVEKLSGDFRQPRSVLAAEGMFHCRLLDAAGNVLADTTIHPPDRRCVVLDPASAGADGGPVPVALTANGPVVFQVRLPAVKGGSTLEIVRLAAGDLPGNGSRPEGELVAELPLEP